MRSPFFHAARAVQALRADRNLQDAVFCTTCWLGFASAVVASVALPA